MDFLLTKENPSILYTNPSEFSGVKKIAGKVAQDIEKVIGNRPVEAVSSGESSTSYIIYATLEQNPLAEELEKKGTVDLDPIRGKRECYLFQVVKNPLPGVEEGLVIIGSDKRGTIYGLFHLSELLGVSPLVNWIDVPPVTKEKLHLTEAHNRISKEPSVKFRGFFINDEWPAFGTWCNKRFGGFNAQMYEHVFELLLRLKGNYLWPAMWSAIFPNDGPGLANAQLADELGVVMGMSHHEPCLRQGEEYRYLRGPESVYGDAWNFRSNREGITRFWEDGLKRSGSFENVITVGMRGEADTAILGKQSTLADNIELLRDVLKTQKELIEKNVNSDLSQVPRMIALYKEVEEYFYGDKDNPGLMGSEELEDVILMLCDDNFGNLRTLPTQSMRSHKGGYGMYYHFDYHGWPVSFEWINSSYLPKVWEQMTTAYEFGVQDLWIVNVGDLATQEFPLSYFLDLAYDFEKWGTSAPGTTEEYTRQWVDRQFGGVLSGKDCEKIEFILKEYTRISHSRRPEAMNADVYHPENYGESQDLLARVECVMSLAEEIKKRVPAQWADAYHALVYYPAMGTMNVQKMHLLAGKNLHYARQGRVMANHLASMVGETIKTDRKLVEEYHSIGEGRWYGMGLSEHVGFTNWCEEENRYPLQVTFEPANKPRIIVSIDGTDQQTQGGPWTGKILTLDRFLHPGYSQGEFSISCGSREAVEYEIQCEVPWLTLSSTKGKTAGTDKIQVTLDRDGVPEGATGEILIRSGESRIKILIPVAKPPADLKKGVFLQSQGRIVMEAEHYYRKEDHPGGSFQCLPGHGKTLSAMKVFPVTASFEPSEQAPSLEYRFLTDKPGEYRAVLYLSPSNPVDTTNRIRFGWQMNEGPYQLENSVDPNQRVGDDQYPWSQNVLDNIRRYTFTLPCLSGENNLRIYAVDPAFVLERIVLHPVDQELPPSYLGPEESFFLG